MAPSEGAKRSFGHGDGVISGTALACLQHFNKAKERFIPSGNLTYIAIENEDLTEGITFFSFGG
jgi:hypothetical protein